MENALLIGLSRQMALQRKMDTIAHNMANVNTAGYKSDSLMFEEYLQPSARISGMKGAGSKLSYVSDAGLLRNFEAGTIEKTGNKLDVAISGDGWLEVQTPNGTRYTRNGQLKINNQGMLVTSNGHPVAGLGGSITFGPESTNITIDESGSISTDQGTVGRLKIVKFENNGQLTKEGLTMYSSKEPPDADENSRILQGFVEKSNVHPVSELTRLIDTVRAYTLTSQTLQKTQDLRQNAIERLSGQQNA